MFIVENRIIERYTNFGNIDKRFQQLNVNKFLVS